ncbi:hypothetical protein ABIE49_000390 [Bradyrhizobium sp. OAE829]
MSHGASGNLLGDAVPLLAEFSKRLACADKYRCVRNDTRHACQNSQDRFAPSATCTWSASLQPNARGRPTSACGAGTRKRASPNTTEAPCWPGPSAVCISQGGGIRRSLLSAEQQAALFSIRLQFVRKERIGIAQISTDQFLTTRCFAVARPHHDKKPATTSRAFIKRDKLLVRRRRLKRRSSICPY